MPCISGCHAHDTCRLSTRSWRTMGYFRCSLAGGRHAVGSTVTEAVEPLTTVCSIFFGQTSGRIGRVPLPVFAGVCSLRCKMQSDSESKPFQQLHAEHTYLQSLFRQTASGRRGSANIRQSPPRMRTRCLSISALMLLVATALVRCWRRTPASGHLKSCCHRPAISRTLPMHLRQLQPPPTAPARCPGVHAVPQGKALP